MNKNALVIGSLAFVLSGCTSLFQSMNSMPVDTQVIKVEDSDGNRRVATTVTTDPTRRLVVFNGAAGQRNSTTSAFVCAEPPPDTALNVITETRAAIEAAAKSVGGAQDPKVGASIAESLRQVVVTLAARTELVEIYRSATYSLCQLHMNGALNAQQTSDRFEAMTTIALNAATNSASDRTGLATDSLGNATSALPATIPTEPAKPTGPLQDAKLTQ